MNHPPAKRKTAGEMEFIGDASPHISILALDQIIIDYPSEKYGSLERYMIHKIP